MAEIASPSRILLTEEAALIARPRLETDDHLVALGRFAVRSADAPERLFELRHLDGAADGFDGAAVTIAPAHTSRLPLRLSRFFGRDEECERLLDLLRDERARLVTITGMGGAGKTRLALETAGRWERCGLGDATWVELEAVDDARHLSGTIAAAIGAPATEASDAIALVHGVLGDDGHLMVLDNFEHLLGDGAGQVMRLLAACPGLRCLVTSRVRLGVDGERELALAPLPLPREAAIVDLVSSAPSVALFVDRAQEASPGFGIGPDNAGDVARLCVALEGIPLAIELAAAQAGVLSPRRMLDRLEDRLRWLAAERADLGDRQRSLRGVLDWSHDLLGPATRSAFAAVSVFRGGWDIEAAEVVLDDPMVIERLAEMRDASLVTSARAGGDVRFEMLDAVRIYAAENLAPARRRFLERRHATHFADLAESAKHDLTGRDQKQWLARLARDDENCWSALRWCATSPGETQTGLRLACGLQYYWFTRGYFRSGLEALERLLEQPTSGDDPVLEARARRVAGGLATFMEDHERAGPHLERALALQRDAGDPWGVAATLYQSAMLAQIRGRDTEARRLADECLSRFGDLDGPRARRGVGAALNVLGVLDRRAGALASARDRLEESLAILRDLGDAQAATDVLDNLAQVDMDLGRLDAAEAHVRDMAAMAHEVGNNWSVLKALWLLAVLRRAQGRPEDAARILGAAEAHRRRVDPPRAPSFEVDERQLVAELRLAAGGEAVARAIEQGRAWDWSTVLEQLVDLDA